MPPYKPVAVSPPASAASPRDSAGSRPYPVGSLPFRCRPATPSPAHVAPIAGVPRWGSEERPCRSEGPNYTQAVTVREILALQDKALRSQLELARGSMKHSTAKGDQLEIATRSWLRTVLPKGLWVGHGEIIDTHGNRSGQHDVIIAFDGHPRFFPEETPQPFFLEGVAAVLEVKTNLTKSEVAGKGTPKKGGVLQAGQRLRTLKHVVDGKEFKLNGQQVIASADMHDQFSFTVAPPFVVFAYESKLPVCELPDVVAGSPARSLDAVFVLEEKGSESETPGGWCANYREGSFRQRLFKDGEAIVGWHHHHDDLVLAAFLTWLTGAINYTQYGSGGIMAPYLQAARAIPENIEE